jgi:autotransporter-associated beta strand protein
MLHRKHRSIFLAAAASAVALGVPALALADAEGNVDNQVLHQTLQWTPVFNSLSLQESAGYRALPPVRTGSRSVTDAAWDGGGGDFSWQNANNWSTGLVPDGAGAIARFNNDSTAPVVDLAGTTVTLDQYDMSDPQLPGVANGTIALSGTRILNSSGVTNIDTPGAIFTPGAADPNDQTTGFNNIPNISTATGFTKTGDGFITLDQNGSYTGPVNLNGGKLIPITGDGGFGDGANTINMNGGSIQISLVNLSSSRNIVVNTAGNAIYWVGANRTFTFSGNMSGTGSIQLNGGFGAPGPATFNSANSMTGTLNVATGTVILSGNGAFTSLAQLRNQGSVVLDNSSAAGNTDRLGNSTPILMRGASIRASGGGANYNETTGPVTLDGGANFFAVNAGGGGVELHMGNVTRNNGAGMVFRGNNLGQAPGANNSNIFINNGTSLLVKAGTAGEILPFAYANPNATNFTHPESPDNTLVTYNTTNGVVPITTYAADFTGSTNETNVKLTASTNVNSAVNVNALVLAVPQNSFVPNGQPAQILGGTGTIHVDSGVILSGYAGLFDSDTGAINSSPGNQISANLDFGSREAVLMGPSALTLKGVITGTGGLTKVGGRTTQFDGASTYTGTTTLNGFNRFTISQPNGGAGPFGSDTSAVIVYGGNVSPINAGDNTPAGSGLGQLAAAGTLGALTFARNLDLRGDNVFLRQLGTTTITWSGNMVMNDPATVLSFVTAPTGSQMIVSGVISGAGRVEGSAGTFVQFLNTNTYTGGSDLEGTWALGADGALSTGSITMTASGTLTALGGPRTLNNTIRHTAGALTIAGTNAFTLAGEYQPLGTLVNITNTATTTFSGVVSRGGFFKTGAGTLVVTGNNTFPGTMSAGNGTTSGGMIILRSNNATGSTAGQTQAVAGSTVAVDGGITIPNGELFIMAGTGVGGAGALRSLTGNNTWGGRVAGVGTTGNSVGADAGSTLTINGAYSASNATLTLSISKTGAGQVNVGSTVFAETAPATGTFNGSLITNGTLSVDAGKLRVNNSTANNGADARIGALSIAGGPAAPTAVLDLSNTRMLVNYGTNASPVQDIRQYLRAGFNNGAWNGNGIISSKAATSPNAGEGGKTGLGYRDDAGTTTVLVRYTYLGDADLNGQVDVNDLGALATAWQTTGLWKDGDFDYNNSVDVNDLGLLATNWQAGVGNPLGPGSLQEALSQLGLPNVTVPEPTTVGVLALGALGLTRRRRVR